MTLPRTDAQSLIAEFANLMFEVVGRERYYGHDLLTAEEWQTLRHRWDFWMVENAPEGAKQP